MRFAVIGAGHGGQAMAAFIASKGYETTLFNRTSSVIEEIRKNNGINLRGYVEKKVENILLTNDLKVACDNSDIIMVCIPANAHEDLACHIAPYIRANHIIVINPGRTLGAFYFNKNLKKYNCTCSPIIAETDTFILTSRKIRNGLSDIMSFKNEVFIAADTKENTDKVYKILIEAFPILKKADSYVYTSMANIGCIFHPIPSIFNIGRIENKQRYLHYKEGITPSICNLLEKLDYERVMLAKNIGVTIPTAKQWLNNVYGSKGDSLFEVLQNTEAYNEVLAPTKMSTRYIYEDISTGIVPMYYLAREIDSPNTILGMVIELSTEMFNYDFVENGRCDVSDFIKKYK